MTFGSVIRILVGVCLVGPALTQNLKCGFTVHKVEAAEVDKTVQFKEVLTNLDSSRMAGWSEKTNIFTAPCAGTYFFTFNAMSVEGEGFKLALMKSDPNKNDQSQVAAFGSKTGIQTGSTSALLVLEEGNTIFLSLQSGGINIDPDKDVYTSFTGYLVE